MHAEAKLQARLRVTNRVEAERLVNEVLATMRALEAVLSEETSQVRIGRIGKALTDASRKTELASSYLKDLETVKANTIALARFAPDTVARLKTAHASFGQVVGDNQTVLATARAVAESLVKGISNEMNRAAQPRTYAPGGFQAPRYAKSEALVVSRSL